jgi:hypothetical protein
VRTRRHRLRVFRHDDGAFREVRDADVLLYWPHGFGDWVQFAYVIPFLEPTNRYWITRFGDDNVSLMEGHPRVTPLYTGSNTTHCGDGQAYGCRHFGLRYEEIDGEEREVDLPPSLHAACVRQGIDHLFWSGFPESAGWVEPPFHTKARALLRHLRTPEALDELPLERGLPSSLSFEPDPWVGRWVEARLRNLAGFDGHRLCVVGRNGYTSVGKNWGHRWRDDLPEGKRREGEECRDFIRIMKARDPRWMFLVVEDRMFEGDDTVRDPALDAVSYAELFGTPDNAPVPFGLVMKSVLARADLCVGVPAAPYHLAIAKPGLATVGLWTEHMPSWFDEPKEESIHLVSRNVIDEGLDRRPGSLGGSGSFRFDLRFLDTRVIPGEAVADAAEDLLESRAPSAVGRAAKRRR